MPALHHPPSPPATPARWFVFGGWVFDITAAAETGRKHQSGGCGVRGFAWCLTAGVSPLSAELRPFQHDDLPDGGDYKLTPRADGDGVDGGQEQYFGTE